MPDPYTFLLRAANRRMSWGSNSSCTIPAGNIILEEEEPAEEEETPAGEEEAPTEEVEASTRAPKESVVDPYTRLVHRSAANRWSTGSSEIFGLGKIPEGEVWKAGE